MSVQRRLMLYLLAAAPLVWGLALLISVDRARLEVNELFDAEMVRLAEQLAIVLAPAALTAGDTWRPPPRLLRAPSTDKGDSDLEDFAIAVWDAQGRLMVANTGGNPLPYLPHARGFVQTTVQDQDWRVYYLRSAVDGRLIASGQKAYERDELVFSLTTSQLGPWLLVLPLLLLAMAWAVRAALAPVRTLTADLRERAADDLAPMADARAPAELRPLVGAMNGLFSRIGELLARERRFTADAAHELRTPLAALRAQWDVVRRCTEPHERERAEARLEAGLERMDRLVTQMLALSRAERADHGLPRVEIDWPPIVEQVMGDCLPLAQRRGMELACEWPEANRPALPLLGDPNLLAVLLRNLLDNALRYAPRNGCVLLRMGEEQLAVENAGEPLSQQQLADIGRRFHRPPGQEEMGSGLGLSIVQRIAGLHGLELAIGAGEGGQGVRAIVRFAPVRPVNAP